MIMVRFQETFHDKYIRVSVESTGMHNVLDYHPIDARMISF